MVLATLLRAFSLFYGGFLILISVVIGLLASGMPQGEPFTPMWEIMTMMIGVATMLASGFLYPELLGEHRRGAVRHRTATGVLLAMPISVGTFLLLRESHPEMQPLGWFFLAPGVVAFLGFVWPGVPLPAGLPGKTLDE